MLGVFEILGIGILAIGGLVLVGAFVALIQTNFWLAIFPGAALTLGLLWMRSAMRADRERLGGDPRGRQPGFERPEQTRQRWWSNWGNWGW